jgi:beta-phosphoglucomutase-like phosphatase (HAD superfamily)
MSLPGMLAGIIFDFNGVLFWDDSLQRKSWRKFAAQLRDDPLTDQEIDIHVHGRNGQYTLEYLVGHPLTQAGAADLTERKEVIYREMCLRLGADFKLSPGAIGLLTFLVENQIPHTIATASAKNNLDFFVTQLNLDRWFDIDKIIYDNGLIPGKPAPDLYLQAARNLNLDPIECVVIEDSRAGIQAAFNAGFGHIIALGPKSKHDQLRQIHGVNAVVEDLSQVCVNALFAR